MLFYLDTDRLGCWILLTFFRGALRRRHSQGRKRIYRSFCRGGEIKGVLVVLMVELGAAGGRSRY